MIVTYTPERCCVCGEVITDDADCAFVCAFDARIVHIAHAEQVECEYHGKDCPADARGWR